MLKKEEIKKIIIELNLPLNEYWITSGAGLVVHGVKEATNDIDLGCTTKLVEHFIKKGYKYRVVEDNSRIVNINDKIELLENWSVDEIVLIDGLPVGSLESIKKQKMELGREKDINDIRLIDDYIKYILITKQKYKENIAQYSSKEGFNHDEGMHIIKKEITEESFQIQDINGIDFVSLEFIDEDEIKQLVEKQNKVFVCGYSLMSHIIYLDKNFVV